jgi:hypothetical protein
MPTTLDSSRRKRNKQKNESVSSISISISNTPEFDSVVNYGMTFVLTDLNKVAEKQGFQFTVRNTKQRHSPSHIHSMDTLLYTPPNEWQSTKFACKCV